MGVGVIPEWLASDFGMQRVVVRCRRRSSGTTDVAARI